MKTALQRLLRVSDEVANAVRRKRPVVALESTIYTHGGLGKDLAQHHLDLVRRRGGIPAIVAVIDGVPSVGVSAQEMARITDEGAGTVKASRRDLAYLAGMGRHGGTTIAATMLLARLAGIRVFGTGGLGGVHRDGQNSMDVSADLTELGRTRVAVVCSGCKGFLDIPRTLEFLETQGCLVATFADGRDDGDVDFPAFWARDSGTPSPAVVHDERQAAAMILAQESLGIESGLLFANPIPREAAIPSEELSVAIEQAVREAADQGFTGSSNTPFVLRRLKQLAGDRIVAANKTLAEANITRATDIAIELSRMLTSSSDCGIDLPDRTVAKVDANADVLVAGAVAVDLSCDPVNVADGAPRPCTSNPARITQSIGGVGYNVALAAHLVSKKTRVRFCSMVADDVAGSTVLSSIRASGLDASYVQTLQQQSHPDARTAQYVAVNDDKGSLVIAMADMAIFSQHSTPEKWASAMATTAPKWLVVDSNWNPRDIREWLAVSKEYGVKAAFEPVSVAKSRSLFCPQAGTAKLGVFPHASVHLATPNSYELEAMNAAARDNGYLELGDWFGVIDSLQMRGARDKFVRLTSPELVAAGVPVQSVQLLPYVPTILTKLGSRGVLLTALLGRDDPLLRDADADEYILTRAAAGHPSVGGVYMRLFPAVEQLQQVVSVNGAGDTFLGVLMSGLAQGGRVENLVDIAQRGAVLSLKCREAVSPDLGRLEDSISRVQDEPQGFGLDDSESGSSSASDDDGVAPTAGPHDKDSDEEELERLVLGNKTSFRDNLFLSGGDFQDADIYGETLGVEDAQMGGMEELADADLFMFDTGGAGNVVAKAPAPKAAGREVGAAWEDSDDDRLTVSLASIKQNRQLRVSETDDIVSGIEYCQRLRQQYLRFHPAPEWAKRKLGGKRRKRRSSDSSSSSDDGVESNDNDSHDDDDDDASARPLESFLRDINRLAGRGEDASKRRTLRPETIGIERLREIPDRHSRPVQSLCFHPEYPVLLSASAASVLFLHHVAPDAEPPNPRLTSVRAEGVDIRNAEFLYPRGDAIFFAGRHRYFHHWDLPSGVVRKTTQILGHQLEFKTMEHFRLSPCGRYMALVASSKKGGGVVNLISTVTTQWIAAARLQSTGGVADFAWWRTGDGLTILGTDGLVGEYCVESRSFVAVWHDDGCVGGSVIALGGHGGPDVLGCDRWVAVGSGSGIANIYDRNELLVPGQTPLQFKERPTPKKVLEQLVTAITILTFSPDGQLLAFGSRKKDSLRLVHLPSCTVYRNWPTQQTPLGRITALAFNRESDLMAVGNDTGKVRLWKIRR
ncbi:hypothetical protein CP532_6769 [Ophiocordyceps camponoti-leonardi (nom. inval.)]|nr:hypothetical protein CP532_6769 [Ophiocordyceps camponoti-leonardi (nom. inval.)]